MKVNVERARQEATLKIVNENEMEAMAWSISLVCDYLRSPGDPKNRFGKKRLNALVRAMWEELRDQFAQYKGDDDLDFSSENAPILYVGLRNQITALDVDAEGIEARYVFHELFKGWRNAHDREKREHRYQLLESREKLYRSLWYAMMLVLWREYGWGADRLNRLYDEVRFNYSLLFSRYLVCRPRDDEVVVFTIKKTLERYAGMGVNL